MWSKIKKQAADSRGGLLKRVLKYRLIAGR